MDEQDDKLRKVGRPHAPGAGFIGCVEGGTLTYDKDGQPVLHKGTLVRYPSIVHMHAAHHRRRGLTDTHSIREAERLDREQELKYKRAA